MVINIYDADKNLVNKLRCQKGKNLNTLIIFHDSIPNEYKLKSVLAEKQEYIIKKPHAIVQKFWDERYITMSKFVKEQLNKMEAQAPSEIKHLDKNLFVNTDLSEVVTRNFDKTLAELKELKLSLDKIQYLYTEA